MTELDAIRSPIGFAEHVLGLSLYPWQDRALCWFLDPRKRTKGSVAAPNGSGKDDRVIAVLVLWLLTIYPRAKVVITSKDARQLDEQTMTSLRRHSARFPDWKFQERYIETPTGGRCIMFTTDEPGRAEGWHKEDDLDGPLYIIANEAKSIDDAIFQAFDRCTYNGLLYISSTGLMQGRFYDSHTRYAADFKREIVRLSDCPHIPEERIRDVIAMYGREHWFTKSTLFSEFISQDDSSRFVFPLEATQRAMRYAPVHRTDWSRSAFCDFAAGGDENVLAIRDGNRIEIVAAWKDTDTMQAVGRFILEFRKHSLTPEEIFGDGSGLGAPMIHRLHEMGWPITGILNQGRPSSPLYKNLGAEMWGETAAAVIKGELGLPDDPVLLAQLTTRPAKIWSDGKTGLMSKDDMRKEGLASPDRADAVCGAYLCRGKQLSAFDRHNPWAQANGDDFEAETPNAAPAGMHAG